MWLCNNRGHDSSSPDKTIYVIYMYKYLPVLDYIEDLKWPTWNSSLVTLFMLRVIPAQPAVHISYKYLITV